MVEKTKIMRCDRCGEASINMPKWPHDDAEVFCSGCGNDLGTVRHLRELLEAALMDEPVHYSDNDN